MSLGTTIEESILTKQEINNLLDSFDSCNFVHNLQYRDHIPSEQEKTALNAFAVSNEYKHYDIIDNLNESLKKIIESKYKKKIKSYSGNSILRYKIGQYINVHKDWEPNDPYVFKHKKSTVHLSSIVYLNDDYKGGELILYKDQDKINEQLVYTPSAGSVILFDALKYHVTRPILSGIKYCYTNFYTFEDD